VAPSSCEALARLLTPFEAEVSATWQVAADLLRASDEDIARRCSPGLAARIADLRLACTELLREEAASRAIKGPADVAAYLRARMARLPREEIRLLFLDGANQLIGDEQIAIGTLNEAPLYPREILRRTLQIGANAIILAHNHPSGPLVPSARDIAATQSLMAAAALIELAVHDHILVSRRGWLSMRAKGLL
jgi:DNA repair protein RadC